jgi:pyruvate/2-oxoglutarate/acetoin dehydrogenase E1 component
MSTREIFYNAAIREAIAEEIARDDKVFLMGEDVATYGGVYRCSLGLLEQFGPERIRDTAISEAAIVGAGIGAAIQGMRPIVEIMYSDFIPISMDQIVNQASLIYFISGGSINIPLVIRTQGGTGSFAGAQHSKSLEAWFTHIPGLKVVAPSTPYDAKGLLKAAVRDNDPVIFCEHKLLYRTTGSVPEDEYVLKIGKADIKRPGSDVTIIAWSRMVLEALEAAKLLSEEGISAEVVDIVTLKPFDKETVYASVRKTNRAVVVQEAWKNTGFAAEVAASIQEDIFDYLDGPIVRVAGQDAPIPFSPQLEKAAAPDAKQIVAGVKSLW